MSEIPEARRVVVRAAVELVINSDVKVLGLGTGSTSELFMRELSERLGANKRKIEAVVPSSYNSEQVATSLGFKCLSLSSAPPPDVYVDSFDQCDREGNVIKGGWGAMTREKLLMAYSKEVLLIGEEAKLSERLTLPVPLEVLPFAVRCVEGFLRSRGWSPKLRRDAGKAGPLVTENGNLILDVELGEVADVREAETTLKAFPGVVETGLCSKRGYRVLIAMNDGSLREIR